jgi:hypothetical protein
MEELALNRKHSFLSMNYNLARCPCEHSVSAVRGLNSRVHGWFMSCADRLHKMYETLQAESMNRDFFNRIAKLQAQEGVKWKSE